MPGRAVCSARGPGGRWTPWHATRPPGASDRANEVGHASRLPAVAGSRAELVGGALAAGGRACQEPSGQIPPPWARWENEAPTARAARSSAQAAQLAASALAGATPRPDHGVQPGAPCSDRTTTYRVPTLASCGGGIPGPQSMRLHPHTSQLTTDELLGPSQEAHR